MTVDRCPNCGVDLSTVWWKATRDNQTPRCADTKACAERAAKRPPKT